MAGAMNRKYSILTVDFFFRARRSEPHCAAMAKPILAALQRGKVSSDLRDDLDVTTRIKKASAAFGALSTTVFRTRDVSLRAKAAVYSTVARLVAKAPDNSTPVALSPAR